MVCDVVHWYLLVLGDTALKQRRRTSHEATRGLCHWTLLLYGFQGRISFAFEAYVFRSEIQFNSDIGLVGLCY